jgi:hypothetical protein
MEQAFVMYCWSSGSLIVEHVAVLPYPITLPKSAKGLLAAWACTGFTFTTAGSDFGRLANFGDPPALQCVNAIFGLRFSSSCAPRNA